MENNSVETKCPICGEVVSKVRDVDQIDRSSVKCENEFYIHWRNMLYKFINPKTVWSASKDGGKQ